MNINKIEDKTVNMYERCVTFEGPECLSIIQSISGRKITSTIKKMGTQIMQHIKNISYDKFVINGMTLYFKTVPKRDGIRVYFLFCSSIQMDLEHGLHESRIQRKCVSSNLRIPARISFTFSQAKHKIILGAKSVLCFQCNQNAFAEKFAEVSYKMVIESFEKMSMKASRKADRPRQACSLYEKEMFKIFNHYEEHLISSYQKPEFAIPTYFRRVYPHFNLSEYLKLKKNESFLTKKAFICWSCYLEFLELQKDFQVKEKVSDHFADKALRESALKSGTGGLEILLDKRNNFSKQIRDFYDTTALLKRELDCKEFSRPKKITMKASMSTAELNSPMMLSQTQTTKNSFVMKTQSSFFSNLKRKDLSANARTSQKTIGVATGAFNLSQHSNENPYSHFQSQSKTGQYFFGSKPQQKLRTPNKEERMTLTTLDASEPSNACLGVPKEESLQKYKKAFHKKIGSLEQQRTRSLKRSDYVSTGSGLRVGGTRNKQSQSIVIQNNGSSEMDSSANNLKLASLNFQTILETK